MLVTLFPIVTLVKTPFPLNDLDLIAVQSLSNTTDLADLSTIPTAVLPITGVIFVFE